jgi:phage FluMu protein Com
MAQTAKERIRFACAKCDQLLSIGAGRIGQSVDCPKCKSPNEVPDVEAAALQIADRKLRKSQRRREDEKGSAAGDAVDGSEEFSQFAVFDDETEFIFESDEDEQGYYGGKVDREKVAVPRWVLYTQGALLGAVALGAFTFGWLFGAITSRSGAPVAQHDTPHIVKGALTYDDGNAGEQPDAGSVVILVPDVKISHNEKIAVTGLRPDDPWRVGESNSSLQQIAALDGAYARTDTDGRFSLQVPRRGTYFMLIISGNATRSGSQILNRQDLAEIGRYFTPATDLIGDRRYEWTRKQIDDDVTVDRRL